MILDDDALFRDDRLHFENPCLGAAGYECRAFVEYLLPVSLADFHVQDDLKRD
jgi:hypothetical protein